MVAEPVTVAQHRFDNPWNMDFLYVVQVHLYLEKPDSILVRLWRRCQERVGYDYGLVTLL